MEISRREFLKGAGSVALAGTAAAAFWKDAMAIRNTDDYREHMKVVGMFPRRPVPTEPAKVYWVPPIGRRSGQSWPEKVINAFYTAKLDECFEPGDTVCVKVHCGERHRDAYIRPGLIQAVVAQIKKCGGDPFVMDTLTYYGGARMTVQNMEISARMHGWTRETMGCPVYASGAGGRGDDDIAVSLDGNQGEVVYIDRLMAEADSMIALTHTKGHPSGMMGSAIKNLGIGGGSVHGKYYDHDVYTGHFKRTRITSCQPWNCVGTANCPAMDNPMVQGDCMALCHRKAFTVDENGMTAWHPDKCNDCHVWSMHCAIVLPGYGCKAGFKDATVGPAMNRRESSANCQIRYADTAIGAVWLFPEGKVGFINVLKDICHKCDCFSYDDIPIVPNLGVLAGKDIVAMDQASLDMITAAPVVPTSLAEELGLGPGDEKFEPINGQSPLFQILAAHNLGAGTREYELIEVAQTPRFDWASAPFYLWDKSITPPVNYIPPPEKDVNDPKAFYYKE